jgi:outer membrane protein insertion porin family
VAPGFGLRIAIPMMGPAPIALDFAFPISSEPGDDRQVFSFFVGINR